MLTPRTGWRISPATLVFVGLLLAVIIIGVLSAWYVFMQTDRSARAHILERVATIAVAVPEDELAALTGTEADLGTPAYETIKQFLTNMRSANSDARFLYVIGKQEAGDLFFYADSEPSESADYSPPGQVYYEATPAMHAVFENGERVTEGPDRDRWGLWISGYAPVLDEAGTVVALVGMDLPANRYLSDIGAYSVLPFFVTLLLGIVLVAIDRTRHRKLVYVEQKAEFLSIASHEIRTPLTGIRWAVEGLLKRQNPPIDAKTRMVLALIHESCLDLIGRVNNLLDLTALEGRSTSAVRIETIDIASFLEDIADSLALSAQQREVSITLDSSIASAGTFEADRQMMHHAFFNLLTNAIKYTRPGTMVRISYEGATNAHVFRVTDQGEGIPLAEQERIFSGYHRTEEAIRSGQYGNGLGLFLAKKAAELHDGSVTVTSTLGEGSTFVLTIPAIEEAD